jgi:hypothetical protein
MAGAISLQSPAAARRHPPVSVLLYSFLLPIRTSYTITDRWPHFAGDADISSIENIIAD